MRMQVWVFFFIVLFVASEFLDWLHQLSLPMPVFVVGGAVLALLSNYRQLKDHPFHPEYSPPETIDPMATPPGTGIAPNQSPPIAPSDVPPLRSQRPLSFEIRKPFQPND